MARPATHVIFAVSGKLNSEVEKLKDCDSEAHFMKCQNQYQGILTEIK